MSRCEQIPFEESMPVCCLGHASRVEDHVHINQGTRKIARMDKIICDKIDGQAVEPPQGTGSSQETSHLPP
jgi:hypothetical protein